MTDAPFIAPEGSTPIDASSWHLLYGAVLAPRSAVYVSVPITGGRRALDVRRSGRATGEEAARAVVAANIADAAKLVAAVRARSSRPVVDPAAVGPVAGWTQEDYRAFWGETIRRFAAEVVFADGFEFSDGCVFEFATAIDAGIPTFDARGGKLGVAAGRRLIEAGLEARRNVGAPAEVVEQALRKIGRV